MDIYNIKNPNFLKQLNIKELENLSQEIREFIIKSLSETGGHLASNLGVVELSIALHKVFDSPKDKFIFDVGHQVYTHKILTGRINDFKTLRKMDGLSGFPKRCESIHDVWETGHSSTSISAASGFALSKDYLDDTIGNVIPIIGDGSLTGGMAFEALNYMGQYPNKKMIIIINDNEMSISKNTGAFSKILSRVRIKKIYLKSKRFIPKQIKSNFQNIKDAIRTFFTGRNIFEDMGFKYLGPVDGHDYRDLIRYLEFAKNTDTSCVIHVKTVKGYGYLPAMQDDLGIWHGTGPFEVESGNGRKKDSDKISWSKAINNCLIDLAEKDKLINVITPAMLNGSELLEFQEKFPNRIYDVGIVEQHAITMAGGLAINNTKPFVSIYSTFLQRAYDQLNHDITRQNLHVVLGIERSGIVGPDGDTHQGLFDVPLLNSLPNMTVCMPYTYNQAYNLLNYAFNKHTGPIAIRYPRAKVNIDLNFNDLNEIKYGKWDILNKGNQATLIMYGPQILEIQELINKENLDINLIHATFIKPIDFDLLKDLFNKDTQIFVFEESMRIGGLSSSIFDYAQSINKYPKIKSIGIDNIYIEHGKITDLRKKHHLDSESIIKYIKDNL